MITPSKQDEQIREEESRERAIGRLYGSRNRSAWMLGVLVATLVLVSAIFLTRSHNSQTTTTDGRNVETPATANSGSAR